MMRTDESGEASSNVKPANRLVAANSSSAMFHAVRAAFIENSVGQG
jgi:hypothetical protein